MTDPYPSEPMRRFAEVDRMMGNKVLVFAVLVAVVSLFFVADYGPAVIVAGWAPLVAQLVRPGLRSPRARYVWVSSYNVLVAVCVVIAALATGGAQSPVTMFAVLAGLSAVVAFPHQWFWYWLPAFTVLAVVAIDWAIGEPGGGLLMPVVALLVAVNVPQALRDAVNLELLYRRKAVIDPLTGCLNRASLDQRFSELVAQAAHTGDAVAAIAIDIDRFKVVNDRHGHTEGDRVLCAVVEEIRRHLRRFELLYRTGGEEFVLLLPGVELAGARGIAERIRSGVASTPMSAESVTVSLGVAAKSPPGPMDSLLEQADAALIRAKRAGRDRVVVDGAA